MNDIKEKVYNIPIDVNTIEKVERSTKKKNREIMWDILKGIGIISIVIGHTTSNEIIQHFVYTYHLVIFYFVSTYFYDEQKYGDKPFMYIGQRLKNIWPKYVFYSTIMVLLHNTFVKYNFYSPNIAIFDFNQILVSILNTMTLTSCHELFVGALWFVQTLLFALGIFSGIIYIARKISTYIYKNKNIKDEKKLTIIKYIIILILTIIIGRLGVYLNEERLELAQNVHTSFLVIPICVFAYFSRKFIDKIKRLDKWYITIPTLITSTGVILYITIIKNMRIELADEEIINGYMFYIVSFVGICFCISLASIINKMKCFNKIIALFGKYSFSIMALHFACVKAVDVFYAKMIIHEADAEVISTWVVAYPEKLWMIYILVGCIVPIIFSIIVERIKKIGEKIYESNNKTFDSSISI